MHCELPGIHRISLPAPLSIGQVNAYLLLGEVPTLVDTGPPTAEAHAALEDALRRLGMSLRDIRQIIITHPHADHYGQARAVAMKSGAQVIAHRRAAGILADPLRFARRTADVLRAWGRHQGIPPEILDHVIAEYTHWDETGDPIGVDRPVDDGSLVRAGSDTWRVLHTPGHSSAHICLLRESDGTLLSGDHLLPAVISSPLIEPAADLPDQRVRAGAEYPASLARLTLLNIATVLPGHGAAFREASPAFIISRLEAVRSEAAAIYERLHAEALTLWELTRLIYPRVHPDRLIFAISNVAGYLDLLAAQGRVAFFPDGRGAVRAVALEPAALAAVGIA